MKTKKKVILIAVVVLLVLGVLVAICRKHMRVSIFDQKNDDPIVVVSDGKEPKIVIIDEDGNAHALRMVSKAEATNFSGDGPVYWIE